MTDIKVTRSEGQPAARLWLGNDLVASVVADMRQELKNLIADGVTELVVDLSSVSIVDSSGIGCLVAAHNTLSTKGGSLSVENLTEDIFELFTSMRLDRHFSIQRNV